MTSIIDVKNVMKNLIQSELIRKLSIDNDFLETIAIQYDDYLKECEDNSQEDVQSLEDYTIDKIEWIEEN